MEPENGWWSSCRLTAVTTHYCTHFISIQVSCENQELVWNILWLRNQTFLQKQSCRNSTSSINCRRQSKDKWASAWRNCNIHTISDVCVCVCEQVNTAASLTLVGVSGVGVASARGVAWEQQSDSSRKRQIMKSSGEASDFYSIKALWCMKQKINMASPDLFQSVKNVM